MSTTTTNKMKEEIENKIEKLWSIKTSYFSTENYNFDDCAEDILKIFVQRIDSRIQEYKTHSSFAESAEVISELEDLKREILNE